MTRAFGWVSFSKKMVEGAFSLDKSRVLNYWQRTRLSCRRVIFGSSPHPPPSPVSELDQTHRERETTCCHGRGGGGRSQIIQRRDNLVFYMLFNTLWIYPSLNPIFLSGFLLLNSWRPCIYAFRPPFLSIEVCISCIYYAHCPIWGTLALPTHTLVKCSNVHHISVYCIQYYTIYVAI